MSLDVDISHRLGTFALEARFRADPGLTALFGHSGSGKTSIINMIGGLIRPSRGRVAVNGAVLVDTERGVFVAKHRRRIGTVFQEGRLFPHLSVRQNLLYGRWFAPRGAGGAGFDHVVELLGIAHLLERRPGRLSGGEQQRVAIGRALLAAPRLLLMDEPLAALDATRREEILPYIERLRDESRIPIVYVSHSIAEVARLANTVVLLANGRVEGVGRVGDILSRLDFIDLTGEAEAGAVFAARVADHDERHHLTRLACAAGDIRVPRVALPPGAAVRLRIRARDVMIALRPPDGLSALNILPGIITAVRPASASSVELQLDCRGILLVAGVTHRSRELLGLEPGRHVSAVIKTVALDRESFGRGALDRGGGED